MMTNPHLTQPVVTWGRPLGNARAGVIAVHGRERDPKDILEVCSRIGRADLAHLAPFAANGAWYPLGFMAPTGNEPWVSWTVERIQGLLDEMVAQGIPTERIALLGFSQGACMVAEFALRHPRRYGALLVFTGSAIGPAGTVWDHPGDFGGTPVLVSGSTEDAWVPAVRMGETAGLLRTKGAHVIEYYYGGTEHIVNDEEISAARRILESV